MPILLTDQAKSLIAARPEMPPQAREAITRLSWMLGPLPEGMLKLNDENPVKAASIASSLMIISGLPKALIINNVNWNTAEQIIELDSHYGNGIIKDMMGIKPHAPIAHKKEDNVYGLLGALYKLNQAGNLNSEAVDVIAADPSTPSEAAWALVNKFKSKSAVGFFVDDRAAVGSGEVAASTSEANKP